MSVYPAAMASATRLYASSIAIVSGIYAIGSALLAVVGAPMRTDPDAALGIGGWIMLSIGIVVLVHGIVLLIPVADRLGRTSGWLMVVWAAIMLLDQWLLGMGSSMMGMGADAGMVAIAVLMLLSGLIMIGRRASAHEM